MNGDPWLLAAGSRSLLASASWGCLRPWDLLRQPSPLQPLQPAVIRACSWHRAEEARDLTAGKLMPCKRVLTDALVVVQPTECLSTRGRRPLWVGAQFLYVGTGCTRNHRTTVGFRQSGVPRQPDTVALQGTTVRLSLPVLRGSLLYRPPLRVPGRAWPLVRRSSVVVQSVEQAIRLLKTPPPW